MTDFVTTDSIWLNRETRQRSSIDVSDLIPSIIQRGILMPLIVTLEAGPEGQAYKLIAGERRLTAALTIGLAEVPVRHFDSLSPIEQQLIELEENLKRRDLSWQDTARAVLAVDKLHRLDDPEWTLDSTAVSVTLSRRQVEYYINLGKAIEAGDQSIAEADTMSQAVTIWTRRAARAADAAMAKLHENRKEQLDAKPQVPAPGNPQPSDLPAGGPGLGFAPQARSPDADPNGEEPANAEAARDHSPRAPAEIQHADALEFLQSYSGERFNFLHCDFPYGVPLNGQANQASFEGGGYDGGEEIYWALLDKLGVAMDQGNILLPSAHLMFWISMKHYTRTVELLSDFGWKMNPTPLVWHKTDGKGIIPDAKRMPRNTYEACLIGSLGDRFIVKPVANSYGAPTDKAESIHTNEKPQPMLNHFLSMFVDEHTRMLDPTCGSGSAVRAAENLGAEWALGLEFNPEFAQRAEARLRSARTLRHLSKSVS